MAQEGIKQSGLVLDLSPRVKQTTTVITSPTGSSETVIATTPAFDASIPFVSGVLLIAEVAYTLGTSASACTVKIRQGSTAGSGTTIFTTGAVTGGHNSAGLLVSDSAGGFDTAPAAGQVYSLMLTVTGGAATSTVSSVTLTAIAI